MLVTDWMYLLLCGVMMMMMLLLVSMRMMMVIIVTGHVLIGIQIDVFHRGPTLYRINNMTTYFW
jgi:hypothetical protein